MPDLDPPAQRDIARRLAEESVILLANGTGHNTGARPLPLAANARVAVVGPLADEPLAFFGCYSMPRHLGHMRRFDGSSGGAGVEVATLLDALRAEGVDVTGHARGCAVRTPDESGFAEAVSRSRSADVIVAVVGDEAGLLGTRDERRGLRRRRTAAPRRAGGAAARARGHRRAGGRGAGHRAAVRARRRSRAGWRPWSRRSSPARRAGAAIAGVLTGRVTPSGRLPVEIPRDAGAQPSTYLRSKNAARHSGSSVDPTPLFAFGHGLSYTTFEYADLALSADEVSTDADGARSRAPCATPAGRRDRGRPALPGRPGLLRGAAGAVAGRVRAGCAGARRGGPRHVPACTRTGPRLPAGT